MSNIGDVSEETPEETPGDPQRPEAWFLVTAPDGGESQLVRDPESYSEWNSEEAPPDLLTRGFYRREGEAFVDDVEAAQAVKWTEVKAKRDVLENGVAPTPVGPVQCDDRSKIKVSGLASMALIALGAGNDFEEAFTLADNRIVTLNAQGAVALGGAVGKYVSAVHAAARALRLRIFDEDATVESVLSIDVEAAFAAALASGEQPEAS